MVSPIESAIIGAPPWLVAEYVGIQSFFKNPHIRCTKSLLKEPERDRKKVKNIKHSGNISLDDVIEISKVMRPRSMVKELQGTVKEILGTCVSVGCTVDRKDPKDLQQEIADGDVEIPQN